MKGIRGDDDAPQVL